MVDSPKTTKPTSRKPVAAAEGSVGAAAAPKADKTAEAKSRFSAAVEEARAGVAALTGDAFDRSNEYKAKAGDATAAWIEQGMSATEQARERAALLAKDGKARASDGLASLGKSVAESATLIDEKLGAKYGDYARTAARNMQESAAKLEAKDFDELGDDVRTMVRKSPGAALGIAAVAGFFLSRMFRGSDKS